MAKAASGCGPVARALAPVAGMGAAHAAARTRTRLGSRFHRLHRRFGGRAKPGAGKRAAFAVAHTLIKVIHRLLATGQPYTDLGADFYTRHHDPAAHTRRLIAQLEKATGRKVVLTEASEEPTPVT